MTAIAVPAGPGEVHATPDGRWVLAVARDAGTLAVVDPETLAVAREVPLGARPTHAYVEPGHARVWVGNDGSGDVSVVELASCGYLEVHGREAFATVGSAGLVARIDLETEERRGDGRRVPLRHRAGLRDARALAAGGHGPRRRADVARRGAASHEASRRCTGPLPSEARLGTSPRVTRQGSSKPHRAVASSWSGEPRVSGRLPRSYVL